MKKLIFVILIFICTSLFAQNAINRMYLTKGYNASASGYSLVYKSGDTLWTGELSYELPDSAQYVLNVNDSIDVDIYLYKGTKGGTYYQVSTRLDSLTSVTGLGTVKGYYHQTIMNTVSAPFVYLKYAFIFKAKSANVSTARFSFYQKTFKK